MERLEVVMTFVVRDKLGGGVLPNISDGDVRAESRRHPLFI